MNTALRRSSLRSCAAGARVVLAVLTLALAGCNNDGSGPAPSPPTGPPAPNEPIAYTAIGASDAVGIGSSAPCIPFTSCPDGRGYVPVVARELERRGRTVTVTNLGVPGAVLSPGIQAIGNQYGRGIPGNFLEQQVPFVPRTSTLVTIFAGGNDANAVATAVSRGAGGGDPDAYIDAQVRTFAADYAAVVRGVRNRAPSARIVVLNLPNLAGAPYTAGFSPTERRWMQRLTVGFSRQGANTLVTQSVTVVDLLCDPRTYDRANFSADGFHPSDAGYAFMAAEIVRAVESDAYPAPASDCAFMRLVP